MNISNKTNQTKICFIEAYENHEHKNDIINSRKQSYIVYTYNINYTPF